MAARDMARAVQSALWCASGAFSFPAAARWCIRLRRYWWVRSTDATFNHGWSEVGVTAVDGRTSIVAATSDSIVWQNASGASRYILHIEVSESREVVLLENTLTSSTFSLAGLAAGDYRAWVKAIDGATDSFASGFWSRPFSFSIADYEREEVDELQPEFAVASPQNAFERAKDIHQKEAPVRETARHERSEPKTLNVSYPRLSSRNGNEGHHPVDALMADGDSLATLLLTRPTRAAFPVGE